MALSRRAREHLSRLSMTDRRQVLASARNLADCDLITHARLRTIERALERGRSS